MLSVQSGCFGLIMVEIEWQKIYWGLKWGYETIRVIHFEFQSMRYNPHHKFARSCSQICIFSLQTQSMWDLLAFPVSC